MPDAGHGFQCKCCYKRGKDFVCAQTSQRYHDVMAHLLAPTLQPSHSHSWWRMLAVVKAEPSHPPAQLPLPPNSAEVAILWCAELSHAEEAVCAATHHADFIHLMTHEAFGNWYINQGESSPRPRPASLPSPGAGSIVLAASSASCREGTDCTSPVVEGGSCGKGKGHTEPMIKDESSNNDGGSNDDGSDSDDDAKEDSDGSECSAAQVDGDADSAEAKAWDSIADM